MSLLSVQKVLASELFFDQENNGMMDTKILNSQLECRPNVKLAFLLQVSLVYSSMSCALLCINVGIQCGEINPSLGYNISYSQPDCMYQGCNATYLCGEEEYEEEEGNPFMRTCSSNGEWTGSAPTSPCQSTGTTFLAFYHG